MGDGQERRGDQTRGGRGVILHTRGQPFSFQHSVLGRVTMQTVEDPRERRDYVLVVDSLDGIDARGYAGLLANRALDTPELNELHRSGVPVIHAIPQIIPFRPGQVVLMDGATGFVRVLYRPDSRFNSIFATDRCNSRCLMCSQPPREVDDSDRIYEHLRLVELMDPNTEYLGITGGEPTLLKDDLFRLLTKCRDCLPSAHIHVLTNGRLFYYESFAKKAAEVGHPRLTWAVPLYSDIDKDHDYVVQGPEAFYQTTVGLYNLAKYQQDIEIRVVLHALTYKRLPQLAMFLYRNFPFVSHVALMGLEIMGFAKPNLGLLWVDPYDYQDELETAVSILANRGMRVSIYNHQLCVLKRSLWPYARKSISDWKNIYIEECEHCILREQCGGFFASNLTRHSAHIRAYTDALARAGTVIEEAHGASRPTRIRGEPSHRWTVLGGNRGLARTRAR